VRIVLATNNARKRVELQRILAGLDVELVPMGELGLSSPVEDGDTFEANALLKALAASRATGLPAIADDSGLEVDALDGEPGVFSARWAGTRPGRCCSGSMRRCRPGTSPALPGHLRRMRAWTRFAVATRSSTISGPR